MGEKGQTSTYTAIGAATAPKDASIDARLEELARATGRSKEFYLKDLIQQGMEELEAADLGALETDRVRRDDSVTRPLDAVVQDLGLDR